MANLGDIIRKVRLLTGRPNESAITDSQIIEYVNTFYEFDVPEWIRVTTNQGLFQFVTTPGIASYRLEDLMVHRNNRVYRALDYYYNIGPPAYLLGRRIQYTQDRQEFFRIYPETQITERGVQYSSTAQRFSFSSVHSSILARSIRVSWVLTDNQGISRTYSLEDVPHMNALQTGYLQPSETSGEIGANDFPPSASSVNYRSGDIWFQTFPEAPNPLDAPTVDVSYSAHVQSIPTTVLFYANTLYFRPVPDRIYPVQFAAWIRPAPLLEMGDSPVLEQWWQYLAYGAAKKIFEDTQDVGGVSAIMAEFEKQEDLVLHRHLVQQSTDRAATIYSQENRLYTGEFGSFGGRL